MNSRRSFIKKIGGGAAILPAVLSSAPAFGRAAVQQNQKTVRIGIIGAEIRTPSDTGRCSI
jgi:anaerobic selenocysteine-containing dehydrogenase